MQICEQQQNLVFDKIPLHIVIGFNFGDRVMPLIATFNNISVISWRSVILVEETGVS